MSNQVRVMHHGRVVQSPTKAPKVIYVGVRGVPGGRGPKGDDLKFEDLTDEQKLQLKGEKGDPGETPNLAEFALTNVEINELLK